MGDRTLAPAIDVRAEPLHFTHLKHLADSPAHYRASVLAGWEPTAAMRAGTIIHALLLGGKSLVVYEGERRGKAWTDFRDAHAGLEIVTRKEVDRCEAAAEAIAANPLAIPLLQGRTEVEVEWECNGRRCSSRIDVDGDGFLVELKSSTDCNPAWFPRRAQRMGYHAQAAWYQDALAHAGRPKARVYILAVELDPPYAVVPFRVTERALEAGRKQCRLWLEQLLVCEASNEWPGYVQGVVDFDLPEDLLLNVDGEEIAV